MADGLRILVANWLDRENPQAGGAEEHLHQVFGRLVDQGHEVTALVSGWPGCAPELRLDGMHVLRTGGRHTFSAAAPRTYRRRLKGEFDVFVEDLNKVPIFAPLWAREPVVLLAHHLFGTTAFQAASPPIAAATWLLERPLPMVYRDVTTVAVSESTRDDLVARGLRRERIEVIHNGIDLSRYSPDPIARSGAPTLLYLGRLKKYKRVDLILRALARLHGEGLDVRLRVAGSGDEAENLRGLAAELGVAERVDFLGYVSEERKVELYRSAWIHVLTSPKEGWGISNLEAAACGTPTVASDAPGLRESVVDGETGLLVPHGDVTLLAAALRTLIADSETRTRMGGEAVRFAQGHSWDRAAEAFERTLRRVVAAPPRR